MLDVANAGFAMHLLPVTKLQFERFMGEAGGYGDAWYESLLTLNPRVSPRRADAASREGLLLTGVLPEEALAFAAWCGPEHDLPTVDEWRLACREWGAVPPATRLTTTSPPARLLLDWWLGQPADSAADQGLFRGGIVEWVREGDGFVGLGAPSAEFLPNLWDPLADVVRPLRPEERSRALGFRLVRRQAGT